MALRDCGIEIAGVAGMARSTHAEPSSSPKIIAYLLYGEDADYEREFAWSALTALHHLREDPRGVKLCVLTDRPQLQYELGVEHAPISSAELADWTREGVCKHRAKPLALDKALSLFDAPVALVDTDTCFVDHPAKLFDEIAPGASVMHAREYALAESDLWSPVLGRLRDPIAGFRLGRGTAMFNSGVVGVDPSDRGLLARAVELLDALHGIAPIFNAEQLAIGTVLDRCTQLSTCEHAVRHYWGFERGFIHVQLARALEGFRPEKLPELVDAAGHAALGPPPRSLRSRIMSRLQASMHAWDDHCRFGYLAYLSALDYARTDSAYANVWLATALQALSRSKRELSADRPRPSLRRSFGELDLGAGWVEPALARSWRSFWAS
jgi:hypothetical protein